MATELISCKRLPSVGKVGNVYFDNINQEFYIALANGTLFALQGLLGLQPVPAVGPRGEQGLRGETGPQGAPGINGKNGADSTVPGPIGPRGERGAAGLPGPAGKNGADSTVPGPVGKDGASIVGPAGPKGEKGDRGDVMIPNADELSAAVIAYRQKYARIQAALLVEIAKSQNLRASTRLHIDRVIKNIQKELQ